ncbi:MAG: hypothetical protein AAGJ93_17925, partial [Bacteroidota bacterium]
VLPISTIDKTETFPNENSKTELETSLSAVANQGQKKALTKSNTLTEEAVASTQSGGVAEEKIDSSTSFSQGKTDEVNTDNDIVDNASAETRNTNSNSFGRNEAMNISSQEETAEVVNGSEKEGSQEGFNMEPSDMLSNENDLDVESGEIVDQALPSQRVSSAPQEGTVAGSVTEKIEGNVNTFDGTIAENVLDRGVVPDEIAKPALSNQIVEPLSNKLYDVSTDDVSDIPKPNLPEGRVEPIKNTYWQLELAAGTNYLNATFNTTTDNNEWGELKNQTETPDWGSGVNLDAALIWNNKWLARTGLEYNRLRSSFSYQTTFDSLVYQENVLLQVIVDSIAGEVIDEIYGGADVLVPFTREVKHQNEYTVIGIPFEVGYFQRHKKWHLGIAAGAVLNFRINQSGKSWGTDNEITTFDKNSPAALIADLKLGVRLSPLLVYRLGKGYLLGLSPQLTWQTNPIFDRSDLTARTRQFRFSIGVQKAIGRK